MPFQSASCQNNPNAWYCFDVTNPHPPDDGIDIGTPNDTPLWFPYSGTIVEADYYVYGGQMVEIPDDASLQGVMPYFIHMDKQFAKSGDHVNGADTGTPDVIGTSGGGVGDLLIHNGNLMPAENQSWFEGHSSGYHTEYGEFLGHNLNEFNQGWHNPPRQVDPTPVLNSLKGSGNPGISEPFQTSALNNQGMPLGFTSAQLQAPPAWMCNLPIIGAQICTPDNVVSSLANDIGTGLSAGIVSGVTGLVGNFAKPAQHLAVRIGVFVLGVGIILISADKLLQSIGAPNPGDFAMGALEGLQNKASSASQALAGGIEEPVEGAFGTENINTKRGGKAIDKTFKSQVAEISKVA